MGFDKQDATAIARKLGAIMADGSRHDFAEFWHNGIFIAKFGIRRGKRTLSHDHIPEDLHVTPNFCKRFQQCSVTLEGLIAELQRKGVIPEAPP